MPSYLVETFAPAASALPELVAVARRGCGDRVRYVRSIFVPEDEICFHVFESASSEAVADLCRRAALGAGRVVEALEDP